MDRGDKAGLIDNEGEEGIACATAAGQYNTVLNKLAKPADVVAGLAIDKLDGEAVTTVALRAGRDAALQNFYLLLAASRHVRRQRLDDDGFGIAREWRGRCSAVLTGALAAGR